MSDWQCPDESGCRSPEFCEGIEGCGSYQEIADERAREAMPMPQCCEPARLGRGARPSLEIAPDGEYVPVWYVSQSEYMRRVFNRNDFSVHRAKFCPFCGQHLPAFVKRENPPEPLCRIDESECYCETCGDRLTCGCYPVLSAYEVK